METFLIKNKKELDSFADNFLTKLEPSLGGASLVLLEGDLGSGKTTFVQSCARYFGIEEALTSPTFVIQKSYPIKAHQNFHKLVHIDAYRLDGHKDLEYLGWEELIQEKGIIIFLEWPRVVSGIRFPQNTVSLSFSILENEERKIIFSKK